MTYAIRYAEGIATAAASFVVLAFANAAQAASETNSTDAGMAFLAVALILFLLWLWLLPIFVAKTGSGKAIAAVITICFGWTLIGWVIALCLAFNDKGNYYRDLDRERYHRETMAALARR
jgi:hypothetical protein